MSEAKAVIVISILSFCFFHPAGEPEIFIGVHHRQIIKGSVSRLRRVAGPFSAVHMKASDSFKIQVI